MSFRATIDGIGRAVGLGGVSVVVVAAAVLAPLPASAADEQVTTVVPAGTECTLEVRFSDEGKESRRVVCTALPAGVNAGVTFLTGGRGEASDSVYPDYVWTGENVENGPAISEWTEYMASQWFPHGSVTFRADPAGVGSNCRAYINKEHVPLWYDRHQVILHCWEINPYVQVRGVADFEWQGDKETAWTTTILQDVKSEFQTRSHSTMPVSRVEYSLRPVSSSDMG